MADLGRLGGIIDAKRQEVDARLGDISLEGMRDAAWPTSRSLAAAMMQPGNRFIFEFKRASPSEGVLRLDADPTSLALAYTGVGDAMSVLTDERYFEGSLGDLRAARKHFDGPILPKDFVIDPRQVVEARMAGADAVLAILAVLNDVDARRIMIEARRLGMDVLVEVHDEAEMHRALALGAPMIGINNRDLKTFQTDLSVTERLAPLARDRIVISESGISRRDEVERLASRVDGFLIGSSPMRAPSPREAARALAFGRVKLCGLRTSEELELAAPACFAGLIFVPGTPRAVTPAEAATAISKARHFPPLVAIFRDAALPEAVAVARELPLTAIQLHGGEDAAYVRKLRDQSGCAIWLAETAGERPRPGGDRTLFDSGRGGTGRTFDWNCVSARPELAEILLAGGIGPANARAAMRVGSFAIDVGSGAEQAPGRKSAARIDALFAALRGHSRNEGVATCA